MTVMTPQEQIEQGFATQCEVCSTGLVVLTEFSHGWATWTCLDCGQESYSLEGDDNE